MDNITKKVGRPFSDNPKDKRLTIRLDKEHSDILEKYSEKNQISKNEAIRRGIKRLEEKE
ncbi:MAG: ribbon-helix-helix protein, CopG family [Clostridia bacterium]|nr:ribbon-helix-helix protein, CopG family [Clostridia bacterium]